MSNRIFSLCLLYRMNKEIKVHDYLYVFNLIIMKNHFPEILLVSFGLVNNNPKKFLFHLTLFVSWIVHYGEAISYLFSPLNVNDVFFQSTSGALKPLHNCHYSAEEHQLFVPRVCWLAHSSPPLPHTWLFSSGSSFSSSSKSES